MRAPIPSLALLTILQLACVVPPLDPDADTDTDDPGVACVPGQQIVCACPGGGIGAQTCVSDGSAFDACDCPGYTSTTTTGPTRDPDAPCDDDSTTADPTPVCGDDNVDAGEACDDGNTESTDGCDDHCRIEGKHLVVGGTSSGLAAIRYTADAGATWLDATLPEPLLGSVTDLELGDESLLAIVARSRAFRSTDDGATWTELELPIVPRVDTLSIFTARFLDGRWFVGGRGQIAVSDDDGATWSLVHDDTMVLDQYARPVAYNTFARIDGEVIAGSGLAGSYHTLRSTDGGDTWGDRVVSDGTNMPGSGADCATMRMIAESGVFWAGASSICDDITYDSIDVWTNESASSTSAWTPVTPGGVGPRFWGLGGDGAGDVMVLWGNANYAVDRVLLYPEDGAPQVHSLPASSATAAFDKVRFTDGAFWIARGPVGVGEASILRSDDLGSTWTAIPEPGLDQVASLAVR